MFVGGDGMVVSSVLREEGLSSVWGSGFFVVSGFGYRVFLGDLFPFLFLCLYRKEILKRMKSWFPHLPYIARNPDSAEGEPCVPRQVNEKT